MKKILILAVTLIGTLALTGCDQSVDASGGCIGSNSVSPRCDVGATYTARWKSSYSTFDASLASLDLSQSNVDITNNSGNIILAVKDSNGSTIASSVFNWNRSGNTVYPSNPTSMSNFVNTHLQHNYTIAIDVEGMETTANSGSNNFVAIFNYGNNSI